MKSLLASELLACISTGALETIKEDAMLILTIGNPRIYTAPEDAKMLVTIDLSTDKVSVLANGETVLDVFCQNREDAAESAGLLARCLFVPEEV